MSLFFQNINFSGNFNTDSSGPPPIRCVVGPSDISVNEGGSISFTVYTQNVPNGATTLYWAVEPTTASNIDFASNIIPTGSITIASNYGTASGIVIRSDLLTEPAEESFTIAVYTDSNRTILAGRSRSVIINDTSQNPPGQAEFTIPGTYTWVAPFGFASASAVTVGAGGNGGSTGGGGGALSWGNITLEGGASYTVVVGAVGQSNTAIGASGGFSSISLAGANVIYAGGGYGAQVANNRGMGGNVRIGQGGGDGGCSNTGGGAGAGGYAGNGGNAETFSGLAGNGGGGGAGGRTRYEGKGGGGVGIYGQGTSGAGGVGNYLDSGWTGQGGSGGQPPASIDQGYGQTVGSAGYSFGGGGGGSLWYAGFPHSTGWGARGAVRIIWGSNRYYPSTNTANV
jgi:hypothetical protein